MSRSQRHRHSSRKLNPQQMLRDALAETALQAEVAFYQRLGLKRITLTTTVDTSLAALRMQSRILGEVLDRDPKQRDFSPTALWSPRITPIVHQNVPTCGCVECQLDAAMPQWAWDWLNRP